MNYNVLMPIIGASQVFFGREGKSKYNTIVIRRTLLYIVSA